MSGTSRLVALIFEEDVQSPDLTPVVSAGHARREGALKPAHSAILMLIQERDYEEAMTYRKTFDTEIYESNFNEEAEKAAQKAAENPEIAEAVQAEFKVE